MRPSPYFQFITSPTLGDPEISLIQSSTSESSLKRCDTMATDDSSGQSMQDAQPASSAKSPSYIAAWGILTLHTCVSGSINPCCWKLTPAEHGQVLHTKNPQPLSRLMQHPLVILILSKEIISGATISSWVTLMSSSDLATPC